MLKKILFLSSLLLLVGCSDTVTQVTQESVQVVALLDDLQNCSDDNEGEQALVKESSTLFACVDGEWVVVLEQARDTVYLEGKVEKIYENSYSCELETISDKSGVKIVCDGDSIGVVKNGRDGRDGDDGVDGTDGKDGKNGSDAESGIDGAAGTDGTDGEDGEDCKLTDDGAGLILVSCGDNVVEFYRARCGSAHYEPTTHFCVNQKVFPKCGSMVYEPGSQSCGEGKVLEKCGTTFYDAETHFCDVRDYQKYKYTKVGDQYWMAENLNLEYKVRGSVYHNNCNSDSCEKYGRYYSWAAAVDSAAIYSNQGKGCGDGVTCNLESPVRGICPEGWHIPDDSEWNALYISMGESPYAMQAMGFDEWPNATDAYDFTALPAGMYYTGEWMDVDFYDEGSRAYFWSSVEYDLVHANVWYLAADEAIVAGGYYKKYGFSIRCLKDDSI